MPYSIKRCEEIRDRVDDIGIYDAAVEFGISMESVKRAMRYLKENVKDETQHYEKRDCKLNGGHRVLCIGDLHSPFDLEGYFDFVCEVADEFTPTQIVFIGDVIDNHFSSYHETDPDGMGGGDELDLAISRLERWYNRFPDAYVTIGNHDRIIMRKSQSSHVPKRWIRSYAEVLNTPNWYFTDRVDIDGVQYIHGEAGTARTKCRADMMSTVQGHLHTQAYVDWQVGRNFKIFGMQVGCGIDFHSYAMAYAKAGKKPAVGCGVIINGEVAINRMMEL